MRSGWRSRSDRRVTIEDIALARACSASRVLDIPCKFWLKPNNRDIYYPALLRDALDKLRLDAKCGKQEGRSFLLERFAHSVRQQPQEWLDEPQAEGPSVTESKSTRVRPDEQFLHALARIHPESDRLYRSALWPAPYTVVDGVNGFVMFNGVPIPVPEQQLEDVRLLLAHEIACKAYPFLKAGQRVRIRGGYLDGLEGILISENKDHSLVVSIEAIQRSLVIRIDGFDVEAI